MNTHDKYELPTLPEPFTYTRPGKSEGALFHAGHMQDYARAAIEADRKRRGEPVAWHTEDHLTDKSATTYDPVVADRWRAKGWPVHCLYAAPQPTSPSGASTIHKTHSGAQNGIRATQPAEPVKQYYYKVDTCVAVGAHAPDCNCWHDEGTGPFPNLKVGGEIRSCGVISTWRDKPAEPVKWPSDVDILELWTGDPTHSHTVMGKDKVLAFARNLLSRYTSEEINTSAERVDDFGVSNNENY